MRCFDICPRGVAFLQPSAVALAQNDPAQTDPAQPVSESTDPNAPPPKIEKNARSSSPAGARACAHRSRSRATPTRSSTRSPRPTSAHSRTNPSPKLCSAFPGITVNRFAANSDTAHFSAEPSGSHHPRPSAGPLRIQRSRHVQRQQQPRPQLDGHHAGTARRRRRLQEPDRRPDRRRHRRLGQPSHPRPVRSKGQLIQVGARANYGDLDKKCDAGPQRLLQQPLADRCRRIRNHGRLSLIRRSRPARRASSTARTAIVDARRAGLASGQPIFPASINFLNNEYDRKRYGIAAAGQWRSNERQVARYRAISALALQECLAASGPSAISVSARSLRLRRAHARRADGSCQ